ncbi:MAG: response regulator [Phycisphaerae bacterium]|jgi:excisionase family DNA binding protein|nr:response regulator [Phycisphaerae bacterium]MBT5410222.1 response regulator [Phycisphaerae bacterium]MBT7657166.1 response regulator [Phycisphaerae bacterium]|tara:strand:+ start:16612 stop:17196 length:585 start_codon:yes stop_codon:yes gene_type:complete
MINPFDKDVLTTGEVAKICNVAARTVSKWFDTGQIEGYRIPGSKDRRIPVQSLMNFMQEHGIPFDGLMSGNTRVLIVDKDTEVCKTLERVFSDQTEYVVQSCSNPFTAGVECERFRPHVMLFDLEFCGDDYTAFTKSLRESDELQATKIIAMSGRLSDGQLTQLTCSGFDGVLRKPFTVRQVIDSIENAVALVY